MPLRTDMFDLGGLRLTPGEGRCLELYVAIEPFSLAGERYIAQPELVPVRLDVSRTTGDGYALRLRTDATLAGPCMRCLETATPTFTADAREVHQPVESEELRSPYIERQVLDLHAWTRDALALSLPAKILCRAECAGLCPACGANLNQEGPDHRHERDVDQRWAQLSELRFE